MIARIKGTLVYKSVSHVIIETNGIGYRIFVPLSTFYELPDTGQPVNLNIYTHVREDALNLFGFHTTEDQSVFQMLISVSGVGPKLALNILSGISAREFIRVVTQGNLSRLVAIPGVGKKTAERMILELKDKVLKIELGEITTEEAQGKSGDDAIREDALSALVNLGYKSITAKNVLDRIIADSAEDLSLDTLLKEALKSLSS